MHYDQNDNPVEGGHHELPDASHPVLANVRSPSLQGYPNYADSIEMHPAQETFEKAWKLLFGFSPSECVVSCASDDPKTSFLIRTPDGGMILHGGFGQYTDKPDLEPGSDFYYRGCGCPWTTDRAGVRYHLIDPATNLPRDFQEIEADIIISRFLHDIAARGETLVLPKSEEGRA